MKDQPKLPEWALILERQLAYKDLDPKRSVWTLVLWCVANGWELKFNPAPKNPNKS